MMSNSDIAIATQLAIKHVATCYLIINSYTCIAIQFGAFLAH